MGYLNMTKWHPHLCCSWSQCDGYRHQSLSGLIRQGTKGVAQEYRRRLRFNILQFDC